MAKRMPRKSALPLLAGVVVALVATIGLLFWLSGKARQSDDDRPLIGGRFELVDQEGRKFTEENLKGKFSLVYFGYTYCPDVCPTELQTMTEALERLGPLAQRIRPVMISVDPERDTPEVLKDYLSNFYPGFVGLTGTPAQVRQAAEAFRVFYRKVKGVEGGAGDEYLMDHSSIVYLMDPEGRYLTHFAYGMPPDRMAEGIRRAIARYDSGNS
jgi:protein SCO1/2